MKSFVISAALAICAISTPVLSFAQSSPTVTHAQVEIQLARLEKAGYVPGGDDATYPADIQAAEAKVASQVMSMGKASPMQSEGSSASGSSASGSAQKSACVGPVDFCDPYFGS